MRAVLQRVAEAAITIDGDQVASIGGGLLVLLGMHPEDGQAELEWLADKLLGLRVFPHAGKPMNASVVDVAGEVLLVSQFTLAADTTRGRRPGFSTAAPPEQARAMYQRFLEVVRARYPRVASGVFGADMQVALVNDGPVTFVLER